MSNLLRRLKRLEAIMTDRSGFVPHSEAWFQHWNERYDRFLATRDGDAIQEMPPAYIDDLLARVDRETRQKEISARRGSPPSAAFD